MQAELKVVGGKHDGKVIPLALGKFLIGRERDCHLRPNSEQISRHHCAFTVDEFGARIRDLGSTNGTFVNDERIHGEVMLTSGDRVRVGKIELQILLGVPAVVPAGTPSGASVHDEPPAVSEPAAPPLPSETAQLSRGDTLFDVRTSDAAPADQRIFGGDTALLTAAQAAPSTHEMPAYDAAQQPATPAAIDPSQTGYGYPEPAAGGYPPPGYPPAGYGYPQAYPGYPQPGMPYGYPPAGYPGYPAPGQPQYPTQVYPGQYPAAAYPQYPAAAPPAPSPAANAPESAAPATSAAQKGGNAPVMPIKLPNPEETGAKPVAPPAAPAADGSGPPAKPSDSAADIIRQYRNRR